MVRAVGTTFGDAWNGGETCARSLISCLIDSFKETQAPGPVGQADGIESRNAVFQPVIPEPPCFRRSSTGSRILRLAVVDHFLAAGDPS